MTDKPASKSLAERHPLWVISGRYEASPLGVNDAWSQTDFVDVAATPAPKGKSTVLTHVNEDEARAVIEERNKLLELLNTFTALTNLSADEALALEKRATPKQLLNLRLETLRLREQLNSQEKTHDPNAGYFYTRVMDDFNNMLVFLDKVKRSLDETGMPYFTSSAEGSYAELNRALAFGYVEGCRHRIASEKRNRVGFILTPLGESKYKEMCALLSIEDLDKTLAKGRIEESES